MTREDSANGAATSPPELAPRLRSQLFLMSACANLLGAVVVFVFISYVLPLPAEAQGDMDLFRLNIFFFIGYLVLTLPLGIAWGRSLARPITLWLEEERSPSPEERHHTLRFPMMGFKVMGVLWGGAAVLFGILNAVTSPAFGALVGVTIALGGVTTCTLVVLWADRTVRGVIALALAGGVPEQPVGPGVGARMTLVWSLATGVPLLGLALVASAQLLGEGLSAERLGASVLFLAGLGLTAGLLAIRLAGRSIADPVQEVRGALARVERGNYDAEVTVSDGTEVGLMVAGFNRMVAGLRERERMRDLFGRHVGKEVARAALNSDVKLGGEIREVGILFVDLTGSTSLAARKDPTEVVAILNDFFRIVVDVTERNGGWVNKFEGDAALCVFGAPTERDDPAADALAAARSMRDRLVRELPQIDVGIGVSAGRAVAGNVGAEERFEYTVIGDPVNEAARLCELAKKRPERVLASESALSLAAADERDRWVVEDTVTLRGRPSPTRLATVSGR